MTMIDPTLSEALRIVHAARRAVALCREHEAQMRVHGGNISLASLTTEALVRDLIKSEARAVALVGNGYRTPDGGLIAIALSERRAKPRPLFTFTRGNLSTVIFGRVA